MSDTGRVPESDLAAEPDMDARAPGCDQSELAARASPMEDDDAPRDPRPLSRAPGRPLPPCPASRSSRVYSPLDLADHDYVQDLGFPGEYPYTRGVQPTMYRGRLWTMRQYAGYATAEESNRRFKYLLDQGQTGLSVAFDLPTQIGYDADHPLAEGEVGKVGVSICSLADMETLFDGIPLDKVSTSMTINAPAAVLLAMYIAVAIKQGVAPERCAAPSRTTSSRNTSPAAPTSIRPSPACG